MTNDAAHKELGIGSDRRSISSKRSGIVDLVGMGETRVTRSLDLCELKARMRSCCPVSAAGEAKMFLSPAETSYSGS